MKLSKFLFPAVILFLIVGCFSCKSAVAQQTAPDALVKDLYKVHGEDFKGQKDRILNGKSRTYLDKYFDKNLANLIWKDLTTHQDEVGVIDFDLFYNTQDAEIKKVTVGKAQIEGGEAIVPVSFTNYDEEQTINYLLKQQNGAWKIYDIKYGNADTLLNYFEEYAKNDAAYNNFAGAFQVGNTTANIKKIADGFELRWAKGSGAMKFYFQANENGKYIFSSEDAGKGQDKFVFDDETLKTGNFVRADGKEMPVKKIK